MTKKTASFNIEEFQLRNQTDPFLTPEQSSQVSSVEARVNDQLDWVAQLLGWRGQAYWSNLTTTVSDKRKLLGGTYGVYQGLTLPVVREVRNWTNQVVIENTEGVKEGQVCYLGDKSSKIETIELEGDKYVLNLVDLDEGFLEEFGNNAQFKIESRENRPEPFVRRDPKTSADTSFVCGVSGSSLILYPSWDTAKTTPYRFNILIPGSRYYFNQPVFFSLSASPLEPAVETSYDPVSELWYIDLPNNVAGGRSGVTGYLVWPYSDATTPVDVICEVILYTWEDPSDWNDINIVSNFLGTWGNKGGALPFNFCFDSLEVNGFDEEKSLFMAPVNRSIEFNTLLNLAYYQKTPQELQEPGAATPGDAWWNPSTGAFAVLAPPSVTCGAWLEVDYRVNPEPLPTASYVYSTVGDFEADVSNIVFGSTVRILNVTGLQASGSTYTILGISAPLPSTGEVILFYTGPDNTFAVYQFIFIVEAEFAANGPFLPIDTEVRLVDPQGLKPEEPGVYNILNLKYQITLAQANELLLTKHYDMESWSLSPSSILRFIGNTRLYDGVGDPQQGEMWWDFTNPNPTTRAAAIWYGTSWVPINGFLPTSTNPGVVSFDAIGVYLEGDLISPGQVVVTDDYTFKFVVDGSTGLFDFSYTPMSLRGKTNFPAVMVADALTSAYRADISDLVFSGIQYYMSPNVLDSETPLRTWVSRSLQVVEDRNQLSDMTYANPLLADLNSGPGGNWERIFIRLPPAYGRNGRKWAKAAVVAQDFAYYGSPIDSENAECSPNTFPPVLYDELWMNPTSARGAGAIYSEPYLYSNVGVNPNDPTLGDFSNSSIYPSRGETSNDFEPGSIVEYEPLHERVAIFDLPVGEGFGDWAGEYAITFDCVSLSGYFENDIENGFLQKLNPPVWDASIYKYPPTCPDSEASFSVDVNSFKVGYAYFAADLSAAEDGFFDVQQEVSWRNPELSARTGYVLPGKNA